MDTRLVVLADVRLLRDGIATHLASSPGFEVAGSGRVVDGVALVGRIRPAVVVVHVPFPTDSRLALVADLLAVRPGVCAVLVGVPVGERALAACVAAGVSGFLLEDGTLDDLAEVVRAAARDELVCPPAAAAMLMRLARVGARPALAPGLDRLTRREREIAAMIGEGLSNRDIAARLHLALPTVKNHVHHIMRKLEVTSRAAVPDLSRRIPV